MISNFKNLKIIIIIIIIIIINRGRLGREAD